MDCLSHHSFTLFQICCINWFLSFGCCPIAHPFLCPFSHPSIHYFIHPSTHPSTHGPNLRCPLLHLAMSVSPASTSFLQRLSVLEICHMLPDKQLHFTCLAVTGVHLQCNCYFCCLYRRRANSYLCLGLGIQDLAMCCHAQRCRPTSPQTYASSYPQQCLLPILVEYDCTLRR